MPSQAEIKQLRSKWRRWIVRIENEIVQLHDEREFYQTYWQTVSSNPPILEPGDFHNWIISNYGTAATISVRRLSERTSTNKRRAIVSLYSLLEDIRSNPTALTRRSYVEFYQPSVRHAGHKHFDEYSNKGSKHIGEKALNRDLLRLRKVTERVKKLVDKQIAHSDLRNVRRRPPTFGELFEAIDVLGAIFREYQILLTGSALLKFVPGRSLDWTVVFEKPWAPPSA